MANAPIRSASAAKNAWASAGFPFVYHWPVDGTRWTIVAIISIAIAAVYAIGWPQLTPDIRDSLIPWLNEINREGRVAVFAEPFSNYSPPYLYLLSVCSLLSGTISGISVLKTLSLAATGALSASVFRLLQATNSPNRVEAAFWVFLIPSVAMNAAWFAQCDALWTAACVAAVCSAAKRQTVGMLIWAGVAISFKAQAAFLAPFVLVVLIQQRAPLWQWLIPPAVFTAMMLPAWLVGWPAYDLATVYLRQAQWGPTYPGNAANPWAYVAYYAPGYGPPNYWLGFTVALAALIVFVGVYSRREWTTRQLIAGAALSAILFPFLLPKMHERYFFLADILTFALAFVARDIRSIYIALLVNASSAIAVSGFLALSPMSKLVAAPLMLAALVLIVVELHLSSTKAKTTPGYSPLESSTSY